MPRTADPILPPPLKRGDTIGIIAPAGPIRDEAAMAAGMRLLADLGFETRMQNNLRRQDGFLAGSDQERLDELHALWRDPEVAALLAVRGGYGCLRLLHRLDYGLFRAQPKTVIGFSDLTVLLAAIQRESGLITYHGPMLSTLARSDTPSREAFFELLTGNPSPSLRPKGLEILRKGRAQGRLLPGNLTSLTHLIATGHEPCWDNALLILEDIGEAPYRIDRLLTHLWASGRLERVAGIILGGFDECGDVELIWNRVLELTQDRNTPVWGNFPCGHGERNNILPVGLPAEMDDASGRLQLGWQQARRQE
ncbi:MAG: S66 peptidase family protein [Thermodesulfobacteriota bacterium]